MNSLSFLLTGLLIATSSVASSPSEIYISPQGNDDNPGSATTPVATFEAARDAARAMKTPVTIILRGGTYVRTTTLELDQRDSNTTYKPASGEHVRIIGGRDIPASAAVKVSDRAIVDRIISEAARTQVLQIDLKQLGITEYGQLGPRGFRRAYIPAPMELFIDGKAQLIARWPHEGEQYIRLGTVLDGGSRPRNGDYRFKVGTFAYGIERPKLWGQADDLYVSGIFHSSWADDTIGIAKHDLKAGAFTTEHPHMYGFRDTSYTTWYALNLLEEIDRPGEYYVDKTSGMLYFYPPKGFSQKSQLSVSMLTEPMVAIYMGRDPSAAGSRFNYNYFHHISNTHDGSQGTQAIFFDDCSVCGAEVRGNIFYRAGSTSAIKFNGGGACDIKSNVFVDCIAPVRGFYPSNTRRVASWMKSALARERLLERVNITKEPYAPKYPLLLEIYNGTQPLTVPFESDYVVKGDYSAFEDVKAGTFRVKDKSKILTKAPGFQEPPFDQMGLKTDQWRKELPK